MSTLFDKLREIPTPNGEREASTAVIPASYAEKAMSSLMVIHQDLIAEKDRTLDLTRRLMDERQARAELESYVRLLETELARKGGPDLRETRTERADGLERARDRVVESLAGTPPAPGAPTLERPAPTEALAPADPIEDEAAQPVAPPPRPPRPSQSYRTKVVPTEPPELRAEAREPAAPATVSATAAGSSIHQDWRQW